MCVVNIAIEFNTQISTVANILSCYIIVCRIHVHGVGQTKFSFYVHLYVHVRVYVCTCVRVCTHWIASKSVHLARHVYWPAGLVANCEQHN